MKRAAQAMLRGLMSRRRVTFAAMAVIVSERLGPPAPSEDEIARFCSRAYKGQSKLNRLGRDASLARWVRANRTLGTIDEVRAACIEHFGANRTPSRTRLGVYIHSLGGVGRGRGRRSADANVIAWLRAQPQPVTLNELRSRCISRFGADKTPSRTSIGRVVARSRPSPARKLSRIERDPDVASWLRSRLPSPNLVELGRLCVATFGPARSPGRSVLHRFAQAEAREARWEK